MKSTFVTASISYVFLFQLVFLFRDISALATLVQARVDGRIEEIDFTILFTSQEGAKQRTRASENLEFV
jgi:hypothetical protein